ncbi:MAG: tetratricopeptide repeat protein [Candidatus Methylomirabilales bacterium]
MPARRRGRRIPLSVFWLDRRITFFLIAVCVVVITGGVAAIWSGWGTVGPHTGEVAAPPPTGTALVEQAIRHERLGRLSEAEKLYRQARSISPDNTTIARNLAGLLERLGERSEALALYREYLDLAPSAPDRTAIEERINALARGG